jgi:hypothetical protein
VTLANPLAAAVIGLSLLGERLQGGAAGVLLALVGASVAAWGVVTLSRSAPEPLPVPVVHEDHPVAAVLALEPDSAAYEPSLVPRQPNSGHLTAL